ncbi:MAG: amino acid ABC transporter substrate-binding protein [Trueperaceae bacterium]|nr:amino acid ABC transporter substrate-binding protein [Trueperaceae bacterium]
MRKTLQVLLVLVLALASTALARGKLAEIQERGALRCGVNATLPGFGVVDADGNFSGFDVDFCKAIAAAVLGDTDAVEYRPLTAGERFTAVQSGEVDVLIRNTTWTSSRDTTVGLNFAPTTFFDGQGFMVRRDSGITDLAGFEGRAICVQSGTTTELNLAGIMAALDIQYTPVIFEQAPQLVAAYDDGQCDGWTTDKSGLASYQPSLRVPADHTILDVTISKEPLGPAVLHGDDPWFDVVKWTVNALINAEEFGITQANVDAALASPNPDVQRLLGVDPANVEGIGLPADAFYQAIKAVGNYGEIYDRNLGSGSIFDIPRGLNALYLDGGILYGIPFR